jgi:hypothetical protein
MHDLHRYRDSAAECLLAADEACQPYYRKLHLSMAASWLWMAASWLWLARQDEARPSKKGVLRHRTPLEKLTSGLAVSAIRLGLDAKDTIAVSAGFQRFDG